MSTLALPPSLSLPLSTHSWPSCWMSLICSRTRISILAAALRNRTETGHSYRVVWNEAMWSSPVFRHILNNLHCYLLPCYPERGRREGGGRGREGGEREGEREGLSSTRACTYSAEDKSVCAFVKGAIVHTSCKVGPVKRETHSYTHTSIAASSRACVPESQHTEPLSLSLSLSPYPSPTTVKATTTGFSAATSILPSKAFTHTQLTKAVCVVPLSMVGWVHILP